MNITVKKEEFKKEDLDNYIQAIDDGIRDSDAGINLAVKKEVEEFRIQRIKQGKSATFEDLGNFKKKIEAEYMSKFESIKQVSKNLNKLEEVINKKGDIEAVLYMIKRAGNNSARSLVLKEYSKVYEQRYNLIESTENILKKNIRSVPTTLNTVITNEEVVMTNLNPGDYMKTNSETFKALAKIALDKEQKIENFERKSNLIEKYERNNQAVENKNVSEEMKEIKDMEETLRLEIPAEILKSLSKQDLEKVAKYKKIRVERLNALKKIERLTIKLCGNRNSIERIEQALKEIENSAVGFISEKTKAKVIEELNKQLEKEKSKEQSVKNKISNKERKAGLNVYREEYIKYAEMRKMQVEFSKPVSTDRQNMILADKLKEAEEQLDIEEKKNVYTPEEITYHVKGGDAYESGKISASNTNLVGIDRARAEVDKAKNQENNVKSDELFRKEDKERFIKLWIEDIEKTVASKTKSKVTLMLSAPQDEVSNVKESKFNSELLAGVNNDDARINESKIKIQQERDAKEFF